jgi:hypothetical protein
MVDMHGRVEALLITPDSLPGQLVDEVQVQWEGFVGDKHFGLTMKAGSSQKPYPRGAQVRNVRQISIVSQEELSDIAEALQVARVEPAWVGANMLVSGIPDLTTLPPGSRFYFEQGVGIVVEGENLPCTTAGGNLQSQYPDRLEITTIFPKKAIGKRGLVAWVERPGVIHKGETVAVRLANEVRS